MNVVLYMRYSSNRQTEQSIEGQERVCTAFCNAMGYNIIDKYIDRATSAYHDPDKRHAFQRMIEDSKKQNFQAVVVYKLDRFSRNRYDSATYKAKLKKNGVKVVSATENISDNPEGVLLESVLEGMAEFYSTELSQKVKRGMNETACKCNSCGGSIPLGYKIVNKKYVVEPITAGYVKTAFKMFAEGYSYKEICDAFNKRGWRTSKGATFKNSTFKTMFRNVKYIGIYKYNDIQIEGGVPAIINEDTWAAVQKRLDDNKRAPGRSKAHVEYMLSGKIFCGKCGMNMIGMNGKGKGGERYYYYACRGRRQYHNCDLKPVHKDLIERTVAAEAVKILTKDFIDELAEAVVDLSYDELEKNERIPALKKEIDNKTQAMENLVKVLESGVTSPVISKRIDELENERKTLEQDLRREQRSVLLLDKPMVVYFLNRFLNDDIDDIDSRRHVLDCLVQSVYVYEDPDPDKPTELEILLNVSGSKPRKVTLNDIKGACSFLNITGSPEPEMMRCIVSGFNFLGLMFFETV